MRFDQVTRRRTLVLAMLGILLPTAFLAYVSIRLQREMFSFQNHILEETARFTVDHAVSQVQDLIRAREREIHMHYRMVAILQAFEVETELARVEQSYPLVSRAFLMQPDRVLHFAATGPDDSLRLRSDRILDEVLDPETFAHLQDSSDPHFFRGQEGGAPFHVTAFGLSDAEGRPLGVAGFFLNMDHVRQRFLATALGKAIDAAAERFSPDFGRDLTFAVYDHTGHLVDARARAARSWVGEASPVLAEAELWDVLPGWTVRLYYASPKGPKYQRNIWLSNTLLLVVMGSVAVGGVLLSMRFLLRQMELASLKSHFVSNITHELKTPLAAIHLYTETLEEGRFRDDAQEKKFLGIIRKETVRLTHLINNILDFARIEQGNKRYRFEPVRVGEVVQGVLDSYAYQLRAKGFDVRLDVQPDLPPVWADKDALGQAVLNLLDNAMKYSRQDKEVEVSVAAVNGQVPNRQVTIAVRDHGVGISPGEQARVFQAFYRVEKGLEHDVKGSGLGLAVVKHVVEAHGGTVQLTSHLGRGSIFTIVLPVGTGPPPAAAETRAPEESA